MPVIRTLACVLVTLSACGGKGGGGAMSLSIGALGEPRVVNENGVDHKLQDLNVEVELTGVSDSPRMVEVVVSDRAIPGASATPQERRDALEAYAAIPEGMLGMETIKGSGKASIALQASRIPAGDVTLVAYTRNDTSDPDAVPYFATATYKRPVDLNDGYNEVTGIYSFWAEGGGFSGQISVGTDLVLRVQTKPGPKLTVAGQLIAPGGEVPIDLVPHLANVPLSVLLKGESVPPVPVSFDIDGKVIAKSFPFDYRNLSRMLMSAFAKVSGGTGWVIPGDSGAPAKPRSVVIYDPLGMLRVGADVALKDLDLVAVAGQTGDVGRTRKCGPYSDGTGEPKTLTISAPRSAVTLFDRRTGAVVDTKTFEGQMPPCPREFMAEVGREGYGMKGEGAEWDTLVAWIQGHLVF